MIVLELCHPGFWLWNMVNGVGPVLLMRIGILRKGLPALAFQHNDLCTEVSDIVDFYVGTKVYRVPLMNCLEPLA